MHQNTNVAETTSRGLQETTIDPQPLAIAFCSLAIIVALVLGVGLVSHGVLRHIVQTLPLWLGAIFGFRRSRVAGWLALPSFLFWFVLMLLIWLYLLGIAQVITGHFSRIEIAMTIIVGTACVIGTAVFFRVNSSLSPLVAATMFLVMASVQWACFRISLLPAIAHR